MMPLLLASTRCMRADPIDEGCVVSSGTTLDVKINAVLGGE